MPNPAWSPDDELTEFAEPPSWVLLLMAQEGPLDYVLRRWHLPLALVLMLGASVTGYVIGDKEPPQPVAVVDVYDVEDAR